MSFTQKQRRAKYYQEHKAHESFTHKLYMQNNPWLSHYYDAKRRCTKKNRKDYPRYGGRGIQFLLSVAEIKELWFRDKASDLKQPSIDRLDSNGHYEFSNCRFIEKIKNSALNGHRRQIRQSTLSGKFVKDWPSIIAIKRALGFNESNLSLALKNNRPANGYLWEIIK